MFVNNKCRPQITSFDAVQVECNLDSFESRWHTPWLLEVDQLLLVGYITHAEEKLELANKNSKLFCCLHHVTKNIEVVVVDQRGFIAGLFVRNRFIFIVLWYCWFGLLTSKNRRPYNTVLVETLNHAQSILCSKIWNTCHISLHCKDGSYDVGSKVSGKFWLGLHSRLVSCRQALFITWSITHCEKLRKLEWLGCYV